MKKIISLFILTALALAPAPACSAGKDDAQSKVDSLVKQIANNESSIKNYKQVISECTIGKDPAGKQVIYHNINGSINAYSYSTFEEWQKKLKTAQDDLALAQKELPKAQNYLDYQRNGLSISLIKNTMKVYPQHTKGAALSAAILGIVGLGYLASKKLYRKVDSETEETQEITQ